MKKRPTDTPYEEFLVGVFYNRTRKKYSDRKKYPMGDPDRSIMFGRVTADMAMEPPEEPELTAEEMQSVARAAKMALYKVVMNRKKAKTS